MKLSPSVKISRALGVEDVEIDLDVLPKGLKNNKQTRIANKAARLFHKYRPASWAREVSKVVKRSYERDPSLREVRSQQMKERWKKNHASMARNSRQNGKHGQFGGLNHWSLDIEYEGETYFGWRELKEETGVSKHLYVKYYLKGMDPTFRIGKNGPAPRKEGRR